MNLEIESKTVNGITPNPSFEFIELCMAAVEYSTSKTFQALIDVQSSLVGLSAKDAIITLTTSIEFERNTKVNITYSVLGEDVGHSFTTHEYTPIGIEFKPTITAYKLPNE
jgi:hypothetical protein